MKTSVLSVLFAAAVGELLLCLIPGVCLGERVSLVTMNAQNLRSEDAKLPQQILLKKIEALANVLRVAGVQGRTPEVIFLQEVRDRRALELLRDRLGGEASDYAIHFFPPEGGASFSVATLSRLPLAAASRIELIGSGGLTRKILRLRLKISPEEEIDTFNVHLPSPRYPFAERVELLKELSEKVSQSDSFLIAGDFNLTPSEFLDFFRRCERCADWIAAHHEGRLRSPGTFYNDVSASWNVFDTMLLGGAYRPRSSSPRAFSLDIPSIRIITEGGSQLREDGTPRRFDYQTGEGVSDHLPFRLELKVRGADESANVVEAFPELLMIEGKTLLEYAVREVFPIFRLLVSEPVFIEEKPGLEYFDELTEERKESIFYELKDPNILPVYETYLDALRGSLLQINLPVFKIIPGARNPLIVLNSSILPAKLAQASLFQLAYGVRIDPHLNTDHNVVLTPTSAHNLRAYSYRGRGTLQDLTYTQLCRTLDGASESHSRAWLSLLLGEENPPEAGAPVLADVLGIFLAEEFKRTALSLHKDENPWMSGSSISHLVLLHDYFRAGGRIPFYHSQERLPLGRMCLERSPLKETASGTCSYYQQEYRATFCERVSLESILSIYYESHYDSSALRSALGCEERNLFQCLAEFVRNPKGDRNLVAQEFASFLARLRDDTGKIEIFLRSIELPYGIMSSGCYI